MWAIHQYIEMDILLFGTSNFNTCDIKFILKFTLCAIKVIIWFIMTYSCIQTKGGYGWWVMNTCIVQQLYLSRLHNYFLNSIINSYLNSQCLFIYHNTKYVIHVLTNNNHMSRYLYYYNPKLYNIFFFRDIRFICVTCVACIVYIYTSIWSYLNIILGRFIIFFIVYTIIIYTARRIIGSRYLYIICLHLHII